MPDAQLPPAEAAAALRAAATPHRGALSSTPDAAGTLYVSCCGNGYDEVPAGAMELGAAADLVTAPGAQAWWSVQVGGHGPDATHQFDFGHDLVVMTAGGNVFRFGARAPGRSPS